MEFRRKLLRIESYGKLWQAGIYHVVMCGKLCNIVMGSDFIRIGGVRAYQYNAEA